MNSSKEKKSIILIFLVFVILSLLVPISFGDDMDWGGAGGLERLANGFENYNGRYFGHFVILGISRSLALRVLIYSLVNTGIVILISRLVRAKHYSTMLMTTLLLLSMPAKVYGQTFGWYSGFANYNVGIAFSLLMLYLLMYNKNALVILLTSFSAQLFMENITIYNVFASIVCLFIFTETKLYKKLLSVFGTLLGAVVMFSNGIYNQIDAGVDGYRTIDFQSIGQVFSSAYIKYLFINNWVLVLVLTVCVISVCKNNKKYQFTNLYIGALGSLILFLTISNLNFNNIPYSITIIVTLLCLVYLATIAYVIFTADSFKENRNILIFYGVSAGVILAPFLVITPFGPRAAYTAYIFLVLVTVSFWDVLISTIRSSNLVNYLKLSLSVIILCLFTIHISNRVVMEERMSSMEKSESNTYIISDVPFPDYGQHLSPVMSLKISPQTFREKYGFNEHDEIKFIPYKNEKYKELEIRRKEMEK